MNRPDWGSQRGNGFCTHPEHENQRIQYICLESACYHSRLLCSRCVNKFHHKHRHRVGSIDKLIEPLSRLNMNSGYQTSPEDYRYLSDKVDSIGDEWQKLNEIFINNMKDLESGVIFQLTTVMKTFTNDQLNTAYEVLTNGAANTDAINQYVHMINFLGQDYLQDRDAVKNAVNFIANRTKRAIKKAVGKIDTLLKKMQDHLKLLDFTKYNQFVEHGGDSHETIQKESVEKAEEVKVKKEDVKIKKEEVKITKEQVRMTQEEDDTTIQKGVAQLLKWNRQVECEQLANRYGSSSNAGQKKEGFQRFK